MKKLTLTMVIAASLGAQANEVTFSSTPDGLLSLVELPGIYKQGNMDEHYVPDYSRWENTHLLNQFALDHGIEYASSYPTSNFLVLLTTDGRIVTYGNGNDVGLCNDNPYNGHPQFVSSITSPIVQIETISRGWLARDVDGGVWGCGANSYKQFGDDRWQYLTTSKPAQQLDVPGFVSDIAVSGYVFAALTHDGSLYMSGYTYDQDISNVYGSNVSGMQDVTFNFNGETIEFISSSDTNIYVGTDVAVYTNMLGDYLKGAKLEAHGIGESVDEILYKEQFYSFLVYPDQEPIEEVVPTNPKKCKKKKHHKGRCNGKGKCKGHYKKERKHKQHKRHCKTKK